MTEEDGDAKLGLEDDRGRTASAGNPRLGGRCADDPAVSPSGGGAAGARGARAGANRRHRWTGGGFGAERGARVRRPGPPARVRAGRAPHGRGAIRLAPVADAEPLAW